MKNDEATRILHDCLGSMVETYGLHPLVMAVMQVIDDMAYKIAKDEQNVSLAKKWAVCADAAASFEHVVLLQFGE